MQLGFRKYILTLTLHAIYKHIRSFRFASNFSTQNTIFQVKKEKTEKICKNTKKNFKFGFKVFVLKFTKICVFLGLHQTFKGSVREK